jgi:hypothetical protein
MTSKSSLIKATSVVVFSLLAIPATAYLMVLGSPGPDVAFTPHIDIPVPARLAEDAWTGGPYECDISKGIDTACIFPD